MKRLMTTAGFALLFAACDGPNRIFMPMAPTPVQQPTPPAPTGGVNTRERGPVPISGTPLSVGDTVGGTIEAEAPNCFPNWDAFGHCRQFDVTAPADGTLVATVKWQGNARVENPNIFLVAPDGTWTHSDFVSWPEKHASIPVARDLGYRIVVHSYGPFPDLFELTATLR